MTEQESEALLTEVQSLRQQIITLTARVDRAESAAGLWPVTMSEIEETAWDSLGKWTHQEENLPQWAIGYKRILDDIRNVRRWRDTADPGVLFRSRLQRAEKLNTLWSRGVQAIIKRLDEMLEAGDSQGTGILILLRLTGLRDRMDEE